MIFFRMHLQYFFYGFKENSRICVKLSYSNQKLWIFWLIDKYNQVIIQSKTFYNNKSNQSDSDLMSIYSEQISINPLQNQLDYVQNLLSWSYSFQRPHSEQNFTHSLNPPQDKNTIDIEPSLQEFHIHKKSFETEAPQQPDRSVQMPSKGTAQILNFVIEDLELSIKNRIKEEIKTFPNFLFRTFYKHLSDYEHLYSQKDGIRDLKVYLKEHFGAKHYTLQQLNILFRDSSLWNVRLNRVVLSRILGRHGYRDIFSNTQRKKKKTYLIMAKVFKLRCKGSHLCSRVQCQ